MTSLELGCASLCRAQNPPVIGTVSPRQMQVFVELPKPWPTPLVIPGLERFVFNAGQKGIVASCIAFMPARGKTDLENPRLIIGQQQEAGLNPFYWRHYRVPRAKVASFVQGLLDSSVDSQEWQIKVPLGREIFICAHAAHDRCCGVLGPQLVAQALADTDLDNVAIHECSHLGGHRFAPTLIEIPSMSCYGFVDAKSLRAICLREGSYQELVTKHYRGFMGLSAKLQYAEARMFHNMGWSWLDNRRGSAIIDGNVIRLVTPEKEFEFTLQAGPGVLSKQSCRDDSAKIQPTYIISD